jgi:hypothetical protein
VEPSKQLRHLTIPPNKNGCRPSPMVHVTPPLRAGLQGTSPHHHVATSQLVCDPRARRGRGWPISHCGRDHQPPSVPSMPMSGSAVRQWRRIVAPNARSTAAVGVSRAPIPRRRARRRGEVTGRMTGRSCPPTLPPRTSPGRAKPSSG